MIVLGFLGGLLLEWGTQILITIMVVCLFNRLNTRYPHFRLTLEFRRLANSLSPFRSEAEIKTLPDADAKKLVRDFEDDLEEISRMIDMLEQTKRELHRLTLLSAAGFDARGRERLCSYADVQHDD